VFEEISLYEGSGFNATFTLVNGNPFLHCKVGEFHKSTAVKIREEFKKIKEDFYNAGYDRVYTVSSNERFVRFLKGKYLEGLDENNKVYVWELD
jgi:hypothetical protein